MATTTLAYTVALLGHYKYAIIFPISILEGPIIGVISGVLVATGALGAVAVFFTLLAGDTVGDLLYYVFGRWGGVRFTQSRWSKRLGITSERVQYFSEQFARHDWKILLISKIDFTGLPTGVSILFASGVARVPLTQFLIYTTVPGVVRIMFLESIGIYLGQGFLLGSAEIMKRLGVISGIVLLGLATTFALFHRYRVTNV